MAVVILRIPVILLFILFAFGFGIVFLSSYFWYVVAYLNDNITSRIKASGLLLFSVLILIIMEGSLAVDWMLPGIVNALGWNVIWYAFAEVGLLLLAARTMLRFDVWLTHRYESMAPLTVDCERPSLDRLVNLSIASDRKWGFFGQYFWWASCLLYGVQILSYVFELVFLGFPLPFAISTRLNEGVMYNTIGLLLMVSASLVARWRMKHWRLKGKWWATEAPP